MPHYSEEFIAGLRDAIRDRRRSGRPTMVAIDGPGCSGKSSLSDALCRAMDVSIVALGTDSFLVPFRSQTLSWTADEDISFGVPHLRWSEIEALVLDAVPSGRAASYRPYDWDQDALGPEETVGPAAVVVVEGLYALHPRLRHAYDLKIWVDCRRDDRMERVVARDGTRLLPLWNALYVPREQAYIARFRPYEVADLIVLGAGLEHSSTQHTFAWKIENDSG